MSQNIFISLNMYFKLLPTFVVQLPPIERMADTSYKLKHSALSSLLCFSFIVHQGTTASPVQAHRVEATSWNMNKEIKILTAREDPNHGGKGRHLQASNF